MTTICCSLGYTTVTDNDFRGHFSAVDMMVSVGIISQCFTLVCFTITIQYTSQHGLKSNTLAFFGRAGDLFSYGDLTISFAYAAEESGSRKDPIELLLTVS